MGIIEKVADKLESIGGHKNTDTTDHHNSTNTHNQRSAVGEDVHRGGSTLGQTGTTQSKAAGVAGAAMGHNNTTGLTSQHNTTGLTGQHNTTGLTGQHNTTSGVAGAAANAMTGNHHEHHSHTSTTGTTGTRSAFDVIPSVGAGTKTVVREEPIIRDHHHTHVTEEITPVEVHTHHTKEIRGIYEHQTKDLGVEEKHIQHEAKLADHTYQERSQPRSLEGIDSARSAVATGNTHTESHEKHINDTKVHHQQGRHDVEEHIIPVIDRHHETHVHHHGEALQHHEHEKEAKVIAPIKDTSL